MLKATLNPLHAFETRAIYDEDATFTDEIDTYSLDKWQVGTGRLFVGSESNVKLVGDVVATDSEVTFRFDEVLAFNVPLHPKVRTGKGVGRSGGHLECRHPAAVRLAGLQVSLTGRVVLARGSNGLITHYQEYWDQSAKEVLKSAKI